MKTRTATSLVVSLAARSMVLLSAPITTTTTSAAPTLAQVEVNQENEVSSPSPFLAPSSSSSNSTSSASASSNKEESSNKAVSSTSSSSSSSSSASSASSSGSDGQSSSTTDEGSDGEDNVAFPHFTAHNKSMTCSADEHARPFNNQIRGVNLGGWMVLEPWITPSLFYQFLNGDENSTAFDMYSFCEVLGPKEANAQLHRHWKTWVTEEIIQQLTVSGAVNSVRLPLGDFQFVPYGPYADGCVDGGLDYVDQLLDWAYGHGITVLIDIHTAPGSQNGFDNSGQTQGFQWTSSLTSEFAGLNTFQHWPIRSANWIGTFDPSQAKYVDINHANIQHSLEVIRRVVDRYGGHPAVLGVEPINEPWQYTPLDVLQRFYWEGYLIVKRAAPYWKYIMHDSFRLTDWSGFMAGCPDRALDTHIYQAWRDPDSRIGFYTDACRQKGAIAKMENEFGPVIVGEWSLATDNCGAWVVFVCGLFGSFFVRSFACLICLCLRLVQLGIFVGIKVKQSVVGN
jgi:Cellulase (glycosyl hydrolase family 5)